MDVLTIAMLILIAIMLSALGYTLYAIGYSQGHDTGYVSGYDDGFCEQYNINNRPTQWLSTETMSWSDDDDTNYIGP
jgi:hypothetical protein